LVSKNASSKYAESGCNSAFSFDSLNQLLPRLY
jgi:hypothetical protein